MNNFFYWIFILIVGLSSCKTVSTAEGNKLRKRSAKFLVKQLDKQQLDYTWFATKGKLKINSPETNVGLTVYVRMRKDSLIWIVARKMSIEGGRVQITPEKIEILNRQDKAYTSKPFSALKTEFNIDLSFGELQNLLAGNLVQYQDRNFRATLKGDKHHLREEKGRDFMEVQLNHLYQLVTLKAEQEGRFLRVDYEDYKALDNAQQIAHKKIIEVEAQETGSMTLKMDFSKIKLDEPQRTPFSVPDHYKKVD